MKHSLIFATLFLLFSFKTQAQSVSSVKGNRALIDIGGESWSAGDKVFALDNQGRRKGLLQIRQVKGSRATADVVKGQVVNGMALMKSGGGGAAAARNSGGGSSRGVRAKSALGYSAALMMNSMKISNWKKNGGTHSFEMTGMGFGGGMFYDYPLTNDWFARGHLTLESFDVKKNYTAAVCNNSTSCSVQFLQTGLYGTFNYVFSPSPYRFWAGGGGGAMIYLSKKSTVLSTGSFFFNTVLMGAAGLDIFTGRDTFIPITFEYQTIPDKQAGVTAMVGRIGWARTF